MATSDVNKNRKPAPAPSRAPAEPQPTDKNLPPPLGAPAGSLPAGFAELEQLKQLRAALNAGQIEVSQFLREGKALSESIFNIQLALGAGGKDSAKRGDDLRNAFASADTGFRQEPTGDAKTAIKTALPEEYQTRLREELIPKNVTGEERARLLAEIPDDIGFDTDRFAIEREGIRQSQQTKRTAAEQATRRQQGLVDLTKLLSERDSRLFKDAIPEIAEEANAKGILKSSGYGDSLAHERARLQAGSSEAIAKQAISDRDLDVNSLAAIIGQQQGFQSDGLSREFSTKDYTKQQNDALYLARENQPSSGGKSGGEKAAQGASTAAAIASLFK